MKLVSRSQWGARLRLGPPMRLPVSEAWLHHSVTRLTYDPIADMRAIERVGEQRFGRFSYSYAYHRPSRSVLVGAGDTVGAHTGGRNSRSLGVVLIGNYDNEALDDAAVADLAELFRWLVDTGRLRPGTYPTGGHRDLKSTACPGGRAYARLDDIRNAEVDDMFSDDDRKRLVRLEELLAETVIDTRAIEPRSKETTLGVRTLLKRSGLSEAEIDEIVGNVLAGLDPTEIAAAVTKAGVKEAVLDALREGTG